MLQTLLYGGVGALLLATILPLLFPKHASPRRLSLILTIGAAVSFLLPAAQIFFNRGIMPIAAYHLTPALSFSFIIDRLAAFFIATISVVSLSVAVYSLQYIEHEHGAIKKSLITSFMSLFILSMLLVVASANTFSFLFFWELMSLSSFFLVMSEHEKKETQKAGLFYFIMTHLSTIFLFIGFFMLYSASGSLDIARVAVPAFSANMIFLSLFTGFGIKGGIIPFHKWLPHAHPASPSNISALMSGVMIKVAIYGIVRIVISVMQPDLWWGILILVAGTISAILGVIYALKEHDLKRLLAYHSIENIGIILTGIGLYIIFMTQDLHQLALLSLGGALFHTLNHALFKSLLFMAAGSVVNATGTKNIEEMGGLIKRMPFTALLFLIGSVAISALPPLNGFASEWMIFQAFLNASAVSMPMLKVMLVVCLSIFALTSALAAACFIKAFSITFLSLPRSENARKAREAPLFMLLGPAIMAALCILTGVFSLQLFQLAGYNIEIPNLLLLGILLLLFSAFVFIAMRITATKTRRSETWGCGLIAQNEKMEYTASGFSEPIVTIFKPIYRTHKQSERTFFDTHNTIFKSGFAEIRLVKFFEEYLYMPIARTVNSASVLVASLQNGNLNTYMLYVFAASFAILLFIGWFA